MHLEETTALGTTEESLPTSPFSEGSASRARLEPPHDPGSHLFPSGHSGTQLPSSGLKSYSPQVTFPLSLTYPFAIPHCPALCLPFLVTLSVPFAYFLIIHVFSKFLSNTCHG